MGYINSSINSYNVFNYGVSELHKIPKNDCREHKEDVMCDCVPNIEIFADSMVITHHSFDGREEIKAALDIINE